MKPSLYTIIFAIFAYALLLCVAYFFQRRLIYFPLKTRPSLADLEDIYTEIYTQTKDQLKLLHWYAKQGQPYIVVFHGNAGHIESRGYRFQFLVDQGYSVFLVSYRGYGNNLGQPTEKNLISDSALALEWLFKQEGISPEKIILFGESLGTGVAVALAGQYPVKALILDGSYSSIAEVGQSAYPFFPVHWLLKDQWDSHARIPKVQSSILFIHSKKDTVVPFRFGYKLFQSTNTLKKHIWLEDSSHNDTLEKKAVRNSIIDFINNTQALSQK